MNMLTLSLMMRITTIFSKGQYFFFLSGKNNKPHPLPLFKRQKKCCPRTREGMKDWEGKKKMEKLV